jgi:phosphomevalonate kinase
VANHHCNEKYIFISSLASLRILLKKKKKKKQPMSASKLLLVGISGKVGSGKTTTADKLAARVEKTKICNFADPLKQEVSKRFGVALDRLYVQAEKNKPVSDSDPTTLGELLQRVGAERRKENPNYWIERMAELVDSLSDVDLIVVGDVRHKNEAEFIAKRGGLLIRLNGDPGGERARSTRDPTHASETDLDDYKDFDLVFNTDNTAASGIADATLAWSKE